MDNDLFFIENKNTILKLTDEGMSRKEIIVSQNIQYISQMAFVGSKAEVIKILNTVTEIGDGAFWSCKNLKHIELPAIKQLNKYLFSDDFSLKRIIIPRGVEVIGRECFEGSGVETIILPKTIRRIERCCFMNCDSLKTIVFKGREEDFYGLNISKEGNELFFRATWMFEPQLCYEKLIKL